MAKWIVHAFIGVCDLVCAYIVHSLHFSQCQRLDVYTHEGKKNCTERQCAILDASITEKLLCFLWCWRIFEINWCDTGCNWNGIQFSFIAIKFIQHLLIELAQHNKCSLVNNLFIWNDTTPVKVLFNVYGWLYFIHEFLHIQFHV